MAYNKGQKSSQLDGGYITVDRCWLITCCNEAAARLLSLPAEQLIGRDCREIFCSDERFRQVCTSLHHASEQSSPRRIQLDFTTTRSDGHIRLHLQITPIPDRDGSILGSLITFSDIDAPLAASRLALNSIAEGVFTVDHDFMITSFNKAAERITGWGEEEVIGRPCRSIFKTPICKDDCTLARSMQAGSHITRRSVYISAKNGNMVPVKVCAAPLMDLDNNIIGGVETFYDLTASLQNEIILDAVADGVFTVDSEGKITAFNNAAEKITGYTEGEVKGKNCAEVLLENGTGQECLLTRCMAQKETIVDHQLFITGKQGNSIPVNVSAAPFLDPQGRVLGGVESFRDSTNRLQTALILNSIADGVFTVDRNWRITSFNMAAEIITGWPRDKAIGQYCSDVFQSSICGKHCAIAESLYTGKAISGRSITIQDYNDKCTSVSISASPLLDLEGNIVGGVETFRDLSVEVSLRQQLMKNYTFDTIISKSPAMQRLFQILPEIAQSDSNVLILGESGTGKELIARAIYNASRRSDNPFIVVNCGALPETLLESELFGYKAGAFTDARRDRDGRFKAAEGGTLFLDEIGDIPQSVQVKLLRVLQHKTYEPLGSNEPVTADVRILAATNRDLANMVQDGDFRDDLFYRLNVVNILLPPLRERIEDIPLLIDHFVATFRAEKQKDIVGVSDEVMTTLMRYDYPGNIRELENIIEYGFILCPGGYIGMSHLPENVLEGGEGKAQAAGSGSGPLKLAEIEKQAILQGLSRNDGKRMKTCRELGISKDTLRRKLKSYGIDTA